MVAGLIRVIIYLMIASNIPGTYVRPTYTLEKTIDENGNHHSFVDGAEVVLSLETRKLIAKHDVKPNLMYILLDLDY